MEKKNSRTGQRNRRFPCVWETPEREKPYNGRESSESFSDYESPLNSFRSPLRLESKRAYSEGKHRDRNLQLRYRQANMTLLKQNQVFSSNDGSGEGGKSGNSQLDKHSSRSKDPDELTRPRTVSGATDWASIVEEEERNEVHEKSFRKRLELGQKKRPRAHTKGHCTFEADEEADGSLEEVEHPSSFETDPRVLERREKQISYGTNTSEYLNYRKQVLLQRRTKFHPWTPDKRLKYSRRGWDTVVRIWRRQLHVWDPNPKPTDGKLCNSLPLDKTEPINQTDSCTGREQEPMPTEDVNTVADGELPESDSEYLALDISELDAGD